MYSYNSIFYKSDKYTVLNQGFFYLNEHPEKPGKGWGEDIPRTCIWLHLSDNASGQDFYFVSTHVNYGATECGVESGKLIGKQQEPRNKDQESAHKGCYSVNLRSDMRVGTPLVNTLAEGYSGNTESHICNSHANADD